MRTLFTMIMMFTIFMSYSQTKIVSFDSIETKKLHMIIKENVFMKSRLLEYDTLLSVKSKELSVCNENIQTLQSIVSNDRLIINNKDSISTLKIEQIKTECDIKVKKAKNISMITTGSAIIMFLILVL